MFPALSLGQGFSLPFSLHRQQSDDEPFSNDNFTSSFSAGWCRFFHLLMSSRCERHHDVTRIYSKNIIPNNKSFLCEITFSPLAKSDVRAHIQVSCAAQKRDCGEL